MSTLQSAITHAKERIIKNGQIFHVLSVKNADAGMYTCDAQNGKITLYKGILSILPNGKFTYIKKYNTILAESHIKAYFYS